MKKIRNSNFELMRITSMFLIVIWHIIMHGNVLENCANPAIKIMLEMIMFSIIIHVNSFVLLSGYFQSESKFKLSKALKIIFQVIFYSILILCISIKLGWVQNYNIVTFFNNITLKSLSNYWFINMYLIMYVFSDFINKFINRLEKDEYKKFLIIGFILLSIVPFITGYKVLHNDGYTFFNFMYLYMIGGYLKKYPLKKTYHFKKMSVNGYRTLLMFGFFSLAIFNYLINHFAIEINGMSSLFNEISTRINASYLDYATPFVIIQTILYFEYFKTLNIKSKFINKISTCTFGIYLIHDNEIIRDHIYKILKIDNGLFYGYSIFVRILIVGIIIFISCLMIELIRSIISKLILKTKPLKYIKEKFKSFLNSFNFNINW